MTRHVRGLLFVDYVRALRRAPEAVASRLLTDDDRTLLTGRIANADWYPMEVFERYGLAILEHVLGRDFDAPRRFGHLQIRAVAQGLPMLLAANDPRDTLMRFRVLASDLFDFRAIDLVDVSDEHAAVEIAYAMGPDAEHAAAMQTMGFFEALLELASATGIQAAFETRSWDGAPRTLLALEWRPPGAQPS